MDTENKSNIEKFNVTKKIYVSIMSLYELADKLFGATYVAFMRSRNLTIAQISRLFSIEQILLAIFDYPTGAISDKIGRKKIAAYGFIVWGLGIVEFAFATNFWMFLPSMILMALGLALISGAPASWLIDQMIAYGVYEKRRQILPKVQTCIRFFAIIASVASYFLIDIENSLPIIVAGSVSIVAGIVALLVGEDNYGKVKGNNLLSTLHIEFKNFVKEKKLVLLSVRNVICYVSFVAFVLFWQIYATEVIGLKEKYLAFFLLIFMLLLMAGNYIVSIVTKKISSFMTSILGIVISILGFMLLFGFQSILGFVIGASLIEFGFGVEQAATSTWICDYIKSETRATYSSIFSTIQAIGGFIITNLIGVVTENFGVNMAWVIAIIAMVIDIVILVTFCNKYKNDKVIEM